MSKLEISLQVNPVNWWKHKQRKNQKTKMVDKIKQQINVLKGRKIAF